MLIRSADSPDPNAAVGHDCVDGMSSDPTTRPVDLDDYGLRVEELRHLSRSDYRCAISADALPERGSVEGRGRNVG